MIGLADFMPRAIEPSNARRVSLLDDDEPEIAQGKTGKELVADTMRDNPTANYCANDFADLGVSQKAAGNYLKKLEQAGQIEKACVTRLPRGGRPTQWYRWAEK